MANLSAITGGGGISTVNHYTVTSTVADTAGAFATLKTITAVADINKAVVVVNSLQTGEAQTAFNVHLSDVTTVQYSLDSPSNNSLASVSFSVIEYS